MSIEKKSDNMKETKRWKVLRMMKEIIFIKKKKKVKEAKRDLK